MQLQKYLLVVAQYGQGGICDKPHKPADYYHTCYGLNGLSAAQYCEGYILGPKHNLLVKVNPLYGISQRKVDDAIKYFSNLDAVIP